MDRTNLRSLLFSTAILTFEELGFLLPDEEVSERQTLADLKASSRIHFHGDSEGWISIRLYGCFLSELTANMLGEEGEPSDQDQADAFGELSNVVCGNLLPAAAGRTAVFDLGAPEVQLSDQLTAAPAGECAASCVVGIDDGRIELDLHLASPVTS
jgi:CheY-specific phosphatase CheX